MKIVFNIAYGGFGLSDKALSMLGIEDEDDLERTDPELVKVVETLGKEANGRCAKLLVFDMPENTTDYVIDEYDGAETLYYVVDGKIRCY